MKGIWLCNTMPGAVREQLGGSSGGGLWMDHVLTDLRKQADLTLRILCLAGERKTGVLDDRTDFRTFTAKAPHIYMPELEAEFGTVLEAFQPDFIHIWGTEYGHTLAMVNAAEKAGLLDRVIVSIQGLCSRIADHYAEGIPASVCRQSTFRDFVRQDNIIQQQKKFALRGELEQKALQKVHHVIGRTEWDRAVTSQINPECTYHFCNETLREPFFEGQWQFDACKKHRIFASSCSYPVKGFHYLLEALAIVCKRYPDAVVSVTGSSFMNQSFREKLRQETYTRYLVQLCEKYDLKNCVEFLGALNAEQMKAAYLEANVFALPSTIENSPNSLGEAMLLGVPCVASDVGGVTNLMHPGEGFAYQSTAPYMLAHYIMEVFAMEDRAEQIGMAASAHARRTHDPKTNLDNLISIYRQIAEQ